MKQRQGLWIVAVAAAVAAPIAMAFWSRPAIPPAQTNAKMKAEALPVAGSAPPGSSSAIDLDEVTEQTGIDFRHTDGSSGRHYIIETVGAGLATFDYDGDGRIDVFFVNGAPLPGASSGPVPGSALFSNQGEWRFRNQTDSSGAGAPGFGLGVAVGDYDNDGDPDLYLTRFGPNRLLRNNGDGTFTDVTREAGVAGPGRVGAGACFFDADGDGDLDLYAANYLDFSYDKHLAITVRGLPAYAGPDRFPPVADCFFRNNGDGTFTDAGKASGIAQYSSWGMGMVAGDYDEDGDTDVFVANDVAANFLWRNDGSGRFEEVGLVSGVAYDLYGSPQGSMGVDCGDADNDGRLDFYQTSYQLQHAVLYRNVGMGLFEDVSLASGAAAGTYAHVTWGCGLVDFDNDGDRDLFVACGHLQDRIDEYDTTTSYHSRNLLLLNDGKGRFVDVSDRCGSGLAVKLSSRGAAFDDLDNDGRVDVVVLNSRRESTVLRNRSLSGNHWLQVRLCGAKTNRDGVGARVRVVAGELVQVDEVHSGRGYQSHYGSRLHFGLGSRPRADRVEVHWIGGGVDILEGVAADRLLTVNEGEAR